MNLHLLFKKKTTTDNAISNLNYSSLVIHFSKINRRKGTQEKKIQYTFFYEMKSQKVLTLV